MNVLPKIDFPVDADGNYSESGMKIKIKDFAHFERIGNKQIARVNIKVHALVLGEISIYFRDVVLKNDAHCYVYTDDYKIIAGPIYEKSINKFLSIMSLPANELIVEVVYNEKDDFDMTLYGINYQAMFATSKTTEQLLGDYDSCHTCNYGYKEYARDILNCQTLGAVPSSNPEIFTLKKLSSVNDFQYDAARASCKIMTPNCATSINYVYTNGTLMNFPYVDCSDSTDLCGTGFVFTVFHEGAIQNIVVAQENENYDYLDKVLIRFNWHNEYGTPWHLKNINCNSSNFNKWRSTINFDEVIDYCGVEVFIYGRSEYAKPDIVILKMKQRPFFKELHLGWSTQKEFEINGGLLNKDDFKLLGRRTSTTTMIFDAYSASFDTDTNITLKLKDGDDVLIGNFQGYSGSQLTYRDYNNPEQLIGLGLAKRGSETNITSYRYYYSFNYEVSNDIKFLDTCYNTYKRIDTYLRQNFYSLLNFLPDNQYWYPSASNQDKCPSTQNIGEPCSSDILSHVTFTHDDSLCVSIGGVDGTFFPNHIRPLGYRLFHDFGEQKTIKYEPHINQDSVEFPIEFCIEKCDMLYLMSLGRENIQIGLEFYDSDGRVITNEGCNDLKIEYDFPLDFCELFDINIEKIATNPFMGCTYRFRITIDGCEDNPAMVAKLFNSLKYKYGSFPTYLVSSIPGIFIDYENDSLTFDYEIFSPNFSILFDENFICTFDTLDFPLCNCRCPGPEEMASWVELTMEFGDGGESVDCPDYMCKPSAKLKIPSFYDCEYTYYAVDDTTQKFPIMPDGSINFEFPCIYKGYEQTFTFYIYKSPTDQEASCTFTKTAYCPLLEYPIASCVPDCEEIPFEQPPLIKEVDLAGCPGCKAIVEYTFRHNTCFEPIRQDLQVLSFRLHSDDPDSCSNCTLSPSQIYSQAIRQIIFENRMGFKPVIADGSCDTTWRIVQSTCWAPDGYLTGPPEMPHYWPKWIACEGAGCCIKNIVVCRSANGISIFPLGGSVEIDTCENYFITTSWIVYTETHGLYELIQDTSYCEESCDWLNALGIFDYHPKQPIINESNLNNSLSDYFVTGMKEYPDYIDVQVLSKLYGSKVKISIVNLFGNVLNTVEAPLKLGYNDFTFNTNYFYTGMYYIYISVDGNILSGRKFIIIR